MNPINLLRRAFRRAPIDPATMAALLQCATDVRGLLSDLETHLAEKGDKVGDRMARRLHKLLGDMIATHGPTVGVDVVAFSGGVKPE
jgi:acetate kinase